MPVDAVCHACEREYHLPDKLAGKKIRCKRCDAVVVVPRRRKRSRDGATSLPPPPKPTVPRDFDRLRSRGYEDEGSFGDGLSETLRWWRDLRLLVLVIVIIGGTVTGTRFTFIDDVLAGKYDLPDRDRDRDLARNDFDFDDPLDRMRELRKEQERLREQQRRRMDDLFGRGNNDAGRHRQDPMDVPPGGSRVETDPFPGGRPRIPRMPRIPGMGGGVGGGPVDRGPDPNIVPEGPLDCPLLGIRATETKTVALDPGERPRGFQAARGANVYVLGGKSIRVWHENRWVTTKAKAAIPMPTVVDLSHDGNVAAIVSAGMVATFDIQERTFTTIGRAEAGRSIAGVRMSHDGKRIVAIDTNGVVNTVKLPGELEGSTRTNTSGGIRDMAVSQDGRAMFVYTNSGQLVRLGARGGTANGHGGSDAVAIAPDGYVVFVHGRGREWFVYDLEGKQLARTKRLVPADERWASSLLGSKVSIRSDGRFACITRGTQCLVVAISRASISLQGQLYADEGFDIVDAKFTSAGKVAVLLKDKKADNYKIVTYNIDF